MCYLRAAFANFDHPLTPHLCGGVLIGHALRPDVGALVASGCDAMLQKQYPDGLSTTKAKTSRVRVVLVPGRIVKVYCVDDAVDRRPSARLTDLGDTGRSGIQPCLRDWKHEHT